MIKRVADGGREMSDATNDLGMFLVFLIVVIVMAALLAALVKEIGK